MKKLQLAFAALPLMVFSMNATAQMPTTDSGTVIVAERLFDAKSGTMIVNPVVHPHGDNGKQFRWMVKYGMSPAQAIQSATINASEALGRSDVGAIEAGRFADIIAVRGNPLDDVSVLEHVDFVMKGGEVYTDVAK